MRNFYIVTNRSKPASVEYAEKLKNYIIEQGGICKIAERKAVLSEDGGYSYNDVSDLPDETEAIISLGGDGTMIRTIGDFAAAGKPVLGINFGTLGFLTETDREHMFEAIDRLFNDCFCVEQRMMVSAAVYRDSKCIYQTRALNDIILVNNNPAHTMSFDFYINDELLSSYSASGMIIATPTGSTAYNLSAGGPLVLPEARLLIATPINAHTLISRSLILPENAKVKLVVKGKKDALATVTSDSSFYPKLNFGDEVFVESAERSVGVIRFEKNSYLETLKKKLSQL